MVTKTVQRCKNYETILGRIFNSTKLDIFGTSSIIYLLSGSKNERYKMTWGAPYDCDRLIFWYPKIKFKIL